MDVGHAAREGPGGPGGPGTTKSKSGDALMGKTRGENRVPNFLETRRYRAGNSAK